MLINLLTSHSVTICFSLKIPHLSKWHLCSSGCSVKKLKAVSLTFSYLNGLSDPALPLRTAFRVIWKGKKKKKNWSSYSSVWVFQPSLRKRETPQYNQKRPKQHFLFPIMSHSRHSHFPVISQIQQGYSHLEAFAISSEPSIPSQSSLGLLSPLNQDLT